MMKFFSSAAIAFTLILTVVVTSSQASASAIGCDNRQYFGNITDANKLSADEKLPYGYLCHLIHTRGKDISEQKAAFAEKAGIYSPLVKNICNWRIDFIYYDQKGDEYMKDEGETVSDCGKGASRNIEQARTLPQYGTTCAKLIVNGEPRLTQCHTISE